MRGVSGMASDVDVSSGIAALRAVDRLLMQQPEKAGHYFSAAEREVAAYRDVLAETWRASRLEADRQHLARVNSVLSVVVGGHFPLSGVPWRHIHQARDWLSELVG
jgi:hypothetical protein